MTKFKSFISWFPKFFEKATHEENLQEVSKSIVNTLMDSKMNGNFLSTDDISFVINQLNKDLKSAMEIKLFSEKASLETFKNLAADSRNNVKKINELIKSL